MVVLPRPPKPHFLQSPLPWLHPRLQADLTQTAMLLLDRATLSQANGWLDEGGRIYLVFPIEKIAAALDRSSMTVKTALSELEDAGLIERRRSGFSKPNRIYVKLPPLCAASSAWSLTARACTRLRIFCPRKRCFARLPILPQRALATAGTTSLKIPTTGGELEKYLLEEVQERFTN